MKKILFIFYNFKHKLDAQSLNIGDKAPELALKPKKKF